MPMLYAEGIEELVAISESGSTDFTANSWIAERYGEYLKLTVNYDSTQIRDCSLFNPPNGNLFMLVKRNGIVPGSGNAISFDLPISSLTGISEITMKFYFNGQDERNFIYFNTSQLSELLR